jgi:hypothetical protein
VFPDPEGLMENVCRVTQHLQAKSPDSESVLNLVPTVQGEYYHRDTRGEVWRTYRFIGNAVSFDKVQSPDQARMAARKFGEFQMDLADLSGPRLNETIKGFHDTPARYRRFRAALSADAHGRAANCASEIDCALAYENTVGSLARHKGDLPERIIHNDTKLNNLLFDRASGEPRCVVDLDTVMPGLALYDFGDMVRTMTSPVAEDATDPSAATMRLEYFAALVEGYIDAAAEFLTDEEVNLLPLSGLVITVETGLRFLTDHLSGDGYFKVHRPGQNLERCRTQFALAASIAEQMDDMQLLIDRYFQ